MNYDVNYFINKFEAIKEHQWAIGRFLELDENEGTYRYCAAGHCGVRTEEGLDPKSEGGCLYKMFMDALDRNVAGINDGDDPRYPQSTPKQRILAALYDIRAKQNPSDPYAVSLSQSLACEAVVERREQEVVNEIKTIV